MAASTAGALVLLWLALAVVYPAIGARMIRSKAAPRVETRLGREVRIGSIDVDLVRTAGWSGIGVGASAARPIRSTSIA